MNRKEKSRINIVYFSIHPAPYRDPFLNVLCKNPNIDLKVYNYLPIDHGHDFWQIENPEYNFRNLKYAFKIGNRCFHFELFKILLKKFDYIIIPGWHHFTSNVAIIICLILHKRIIFYSDNICDKRNQKLLGWVKRKVVQRFKIIWVPGIASEQHYLNDYGIDPIKIIHGIYSLNESSIKSQYDQEYINRMDIRKALKIENAFRVILMVANLTENRDYPYLIDIFSEYQKINKSSYLVIVGKGESLESIKIRVENNKIKNCSIINGVRFNDLIKYYIISDIYIHTGSEPFSTALELASIVGLPIISSYKVGATADYVVDGLTGFVVKNYSSIEEWVQRINDIDKDTAKSFKQNSIDRSKQIGLMNQYEKFISKIYEDLN